MIQLARYTPARSRGFRKTQMVPIDEEIAWMLEVLERCIEAIMSSHKYRLVHAPLIYLPTMESIKR